MRLTYRQCLYCGYFKGWSSKCAAFPDGIPQPIRDGHHDHTQPYPGDHGVRYRSKEELRARRDQVPCFRCKHYLTALQCAAFLDGIPDEILDGQVDHTDPRPDDNGYQFSPTDREIVI